jgi:hypothetical protein
MVQKLLINLPVLSIYDLHTTALPNRNIHYYFKYSNPINKPITIIDVWVSINANGQNIAEGKFINILGSEIDPKGEATAELFIPMTTYIIQNIEQTRKGSDVFLQIRTNALLCTTLHKGKSIVLGEPIRSQFNQDNRGAIEHKIPQSEWVKLLSEMQWSELELIEIPNSIIRAIPELDRAIICYKDAQKQYREGHWSQAVINCRSVFEALVKDATEQNKMSLAPDAINKLIGEGPKSDSINDLIIGLTSLLQLARHQQQPQIEIDPSEATIAIRVTGSILTYICDNIKI